jgi:ribosomal protein S12 methylthiotransferase
VGLISLGCAKNLVDAEVMVGTLIKDGMELTNDASTADVLIVNTCSFIEAAQQESVDAILESAELREAQNRGQGLVVSGCLPQRFRTELPKLLPEVDAFIGIDQVTDIGRVVRQAVEHRSRRLSEPAPETRRKRILRSPTKSEAAGRLAPGDSKAITAAVKQLTPKTGAPAGSAAIQSGSPAVPGAPTVQVHSSPRYIPDYATPRFRLTPRHFAYVKIAEGCNHPCSFCIIPRMRGTHRSRPQADIIQEAKQLLSEGVKELNLISQDSTYYGLDLRPSRTGAISSPEKFSAAAQSLSSETPTLCTLLRELNDLPGDFWIRLLYTHPAHWTDELIRTIAECPKVARYVDIPLQHIHHNMLERMRRETTREYIIDLLARIRKGIPGIALRTTFIVGFPGETEPCFEALLEFIRETRFERLGVFTYSHEEGTRAARMADQIPESVKKRRRKRAMAEQLLVARQLSAACVGRVIPVLVEKELDPDDMAAVGISSWEHGLLRGSNTSPSLPDHCLVARGQSDAPDIDGRVYVRGQLPPGSFARVKVMGHTDYDLVAEPA